MSLLLSPAKLGGMSLQNRLVMASCGTNKADLSGQVTPELIDWYRVRSRGFGLCVTEHAYVSEWGKAAPKMLSVSRDSDIPGLKQLVDAVHENGCKIQIQLDHGAGWQVPQLQACLDPEKNPELRRVTDECTDEQLDQVAADFAAAACRAKAAGFDGVQIKACHVYLLAQFFSPLTNRRTQGAYAGTCFDSRFRLTLNVLRAVRAAVGEGYPVSIRIPSGDFEPGGITVEEARYAACLLAENGADLLDISGGVKYRYFHPQKTEPGWFAEYSMAIRKQVSVPVVVTGGITTGEQAEAILQSGAADLVGVCRAWLKEPGWGLRTVSEYKE